MKKSLLLVVLAGAGVTTPAAMLPSQAPAARADVAWNHVGSVKIGNTPLVSFSMQNQWSGTNHRTAFNVDATPVAKVLGAPSNVPARGGLQIIERLDADRLIISSPQTPSYIDEPYKSLKSRLRLNFWEALGSNLSADNIPQLTTEQRQRLGQEIRAVLTPFTKNISRTYFRAIPGTRTIGGLESRGYRYTSMVNVSTVKARPEWVRFAAEWWLAEGLAGDEEIRSFTQSANNIKNDAGPTTASMWANEYGPVMWEAAPEEAHQALASLLGAPESSNYGFQGTPVQFFATISGPPAMQMAMGGDIKIALELKNRHTNPTEATVFEAPTGGQRVEIEPFLGMARNFIRRGRTELEKMMK